MRTGRIKHYERAVQQTLDPSADPVLRPEPTRLRDLRIRVQGPILIALICCLAFFALLGWLIFN